MNLMAQKIFLSSIGFFLIVGVAQGATVVKADELSAVQIAKVKTLIGRHACLSCHSTERKLVGPSYRDIALRYAQNSKAVDLLAAKIKSGGAGQWGQIPMPAHAKISEADLKLLAAWILAGASQ